MPGDREEDDSVLDEARAALSRARAQAEAELQKAQAEAALSRAEADARLSVAQAETDFNEARARAHGEGPSASTRATAPEEPSRTSLAATVTFAPASRRMLEELAQSEGLAPGEMLGVLIARGWYLRNIEESGARLFVKRGRRLYRLREAGAGRGSSRRLR